MGNVVWDKNLCAKIIIKKLDDDKLYAIVSRSGVVGVLNVEIDEQSTVRRLLRLSSIIEAAEDDEELERLLHQIETYWELIRDREAV